MVDIQREVSVVVIMNKCTVQCKLVSLFVAKLFTKWRSIQRTFPLGCTGFGGLETGQH